MIEEHRAQSNQCSDPVRRAIEAAAADASFETHKELGIEHLLFHLLQMDDDIPQVFRAFHVDLARIRLALEQTLSERRTDRSGTPTFGPKLRKLLAAGADISDAYFAGEPVRGGFLLLALLENSEFADVRRACREWNNIRPEVLRRDFQAIVSGRRVFTSPAVFERRIHVTLYVYGAGLVLYTLYSLFTRSGLMSIWLSWMDAGWIRVGRGPLGIILFLVPAAVAIFLPVSLGQFVARRFAPQLARAIDSWGVASEGGSPRTQRTGVQTWRSIFKVTAAVWLFSPRSAHSYSGSRNRNEPEKSMKSTWRARPECYPPVLSTSG